MAKEARCPWAKPKAIEPTTKIAAAAVADLSARARRAMGILPPEQRSALELAYFGGRTTAEVAALEGIPQGTVKSRIRAALLRLRAEMAKESGR